LENTLCSLKS